jgi:hypothetical protein
MIVRQAVRSALSLKAASDATALSFASVGLFDCYQHKDKKDRVVFFDTVRV